MTAAPFPPWPAGSDFTLVNLNLRFGLAQDGENRWDRRRRLWPTFLERCPADFLVLQEVNDFQADDLQALLGAYGCVGRRRPAPQSWQHNLIWYRREWTCEASDHFYLSPTPQIPSRFRASRWPRQCSAAVFTRDGCRLAIAATHLDFDFQVQEASARLIRRRVDAMAAAANATIVAGDFNAPPGTPAHRVLTVDPHVDGRTIPSFKDVFAPPYPGTHHGFTGSRDGDYIDWILYHGAIEVLRCGVLQTPIEGRHLSDHYPVWAAFGWQAPQRAATHAADHQPAVRRTK
jgi:endonuclease/exonuclease/phosphatase family metal-dependent hydrolase